MTRATTLRLAPAASAAVLVAAILLVMFPFVFALSTSTKTYEEFLHEWWLPSLPPHLENYELAWRLVGRPLWNTVVVDVVSVAVTLLFASMTAYVFARHRFPGKEPLFTLILCLIMIPGILIGSQITVALPEKALRGSLASVLALSSLKMLGAF